MNDAAGPGLERRLARGRALVEAHAYARAVEVLGDLVATLEPSTTTGPPRSGAAPDRPGGDDTLRARILVRALISLYSARLEVVRPEVDAALLDRAWAVATSHGLADLFAAVLGARAHGFLRQGDVAGALAVFDRAEPHLGACSPEDRVRFLLNRGTTHLERGSLVAAGRDLDRAEREGRHAGVLELAQKARHNRGYLAYLGGDLPRALDLVATPVAPPDRHPAVRALLDDPIALMDRARILQEAGLVEDADDLLVVALDRLGEDARGQDRGEAHHARARGALVSGDLELAAEQAAAAARRFRERGNTRWLRRTAFTELAVVIEQLQSGGAATRRGDPSGAAVVAARRADAPVLVDRIERLRAEAEAANDPDIARPARFMLAEAAILAGDRGRAAAALGPAAPPDEDAVSIRLRWYRARASLAAIAGEDVQAVVREGLAVLWRAQARVGSVDLRTAMAIHGHELAELGVADALARGDEHEVHAAVERAHASSTRLSPVRVRASAAERDLLARLRRANDALWLLDVTTARAEVERLRTEVGELQAELRRHEWQRAGTTDRADVAELDAVQDRLAAAGAVAATFARVGPKLVAVRIEPDAVTVVELGPVRRVVDLVERVRSDLQAVALPGVPEAVRAVMRRSLATGLDQLDDLVVTPLAATGRPLVVVPHGPLAVVPWALLGGRRGLATTVAPCLSEWVRAMGAATRSAHRDGLVAVAGPGLARAGAEAAAVASAWGGARTVVGDAATADAVRRALQRGGIVHLAAHGVHQVSSPLFSSLRLADGPIFAHELGADPAARLVVLSACEVGSATIRQGDEPLGLTAALVQAGVPTVVAGLARVGDDLAHDVMIDVHRRLAAGDAPAAALGAAAAAALDAGRVAPFQCVGAGLVPVASGRR